MYSNKSKKKNRFSIFKLLSIFLLLVLLGFTANIYLNSQYESLTSKFYNNFNNYEFSNAKTILNSKVLTVKKQNLNTDLSSYFTDIVNKVCLALSNDEISSTKALEILNEIKSYNILNSSLDKLIIALEENSEDIASTTTDSTLNNDSINTESNFDDNEDSYLNLGIAAFNQKDYETAMEYFNLIPQSSSNDYKIAKEYIEDFELNYKNYLLESVDELVANKYYTKALNILSNYDMNLLNEDEITEIENKISSIKLFREEYQGDDSEYTSNAILQEITPRNINSLSIASKTSYLVYLSLDKQITYVYEGSNNNWNLVKEFESSTGIEGKETPKGIFSVTNRGDWFFSEEFQQGAKYWVQFMGDYLFHSLPFDESQENIVDYTLGEPASHGCIRLAVEDAKWLYDNISNNTKIIIN
ncbi:L,D-transpeptidase [Clostridium sp. AL.422]|uniref:L,D-transpeptidase n=1 Tax=Clostridium TaxID=1485 RepID=UPI00293DCD41|nr:MULTISPECIES: L,D-transpeptidase [unclassified Clostridium]MDV4151683.1 L,D-transpeptidase [Clostridium sp. AL.422]